MLNKRKFFDYFENNDDGTTTFFIYTRAYGVKKVLVDTEDAPKFFSFKISVSKDNHAKTYYASTKLGKIHRIIMNPHTSKEIVDHIDRNGLNNTKDNLRIVDTSINNRNCNIRKDNKSSLRGIEEFPTRYRLYYYNDKKEKRTKSFSKLKYGDEGARLLILSFREMVYKKFGYIA